MHKTKVKICGLTRKEDVKVCMAAGADILGFVVEYPLPVVWNLSTKEAAALIKEVKEPHKSCVVTGGSIKKVTALADILRPSFVQLHYSENIADTTIIAEKLKKLGIRVIKTIPPNVRERVAQFGTPDIKTAVSTLCKTDIYALLADTRTPQNAAEKGSALNLDFCSQIISTSEKPVIIAGGINSKNIFKVLTHTGTEIIDVMTGVERRPSHKDANAVFELLSQIKTWNSRCE